MRPTDMGARIQPCATTCLTGHVRRPHARSSTGASQSQRARESRKLNGHGIPPPDDRAPTRVRMMGDILKIAVRSSDAATRGRTSTGLGGRQVDGRTRRGGLGRACRPGNDHSHAAFYQIPTSSLPLYLDSSLEKCVAMKVRLLRFPSVSKARLASTATMRTSAVSTTTFNPRRSSRARPCRSWTRSSVSRPLGSVGKPHAERCAIRSRITDPMTCAQPGWRCGDTAGLRHRHDDGDRVGHRIGAL
jgi:hypothetical protein